jgi:hypothetical protein
MMLSQPNPYVNTNPPTHINGTTKLGTQQNPQITYFSGDTNITATGNAEGYGVLIVNGSLTISGSLTYTGLIIVVGSTKINSDPETTIQGSATVYGAIWTTDLSVTVGGNAGVRYSTQALQLANTINSGVTLVPQHVQVLAWNQG